MEKGQPKVSSMLDFTESSIRWEAGKQKYVNRVGRHSTEVVFTLRAHEAWVRVTAFPRFFQRFSRLDVAEFNRQRTA